MALFLSAAFINSFFKHYSLPVYLRKVSTKICLYAYLNRPVHKRLCIKCVKKPYYYLHPIKPMKHNTLGVTKQPSHTTKPDLIRCGTAYFRTTISMRMVSVFRHGTHQAQKPTTNPIPLTNDIVFQ